MTYLGRFDDFLYVPGSAGASFFKKALSEAGNFACQLYRDHPGIANPFDTFGFGRGVWDELCRSRPPGLPPSLPSTFAGGQCLVAYDVKLYIKVTNLRDNTFTVDDRVLVFGGAISAPVVKGGNGVAGNITIKTQSGGREDFLASINSWQRVDECRIQWVKRRDGQPDDCGNLPSPGYPTVVLPEDRLRTNVTVTTSTNATYVIPVIVALPKAEVDFDLNVPLTFNLGGLHFHVNADGFHSGKPGGRSAKDAKDIKDRLDDIVDPPNPDEDPRLTPTFPPVADSGEENELSGAKWIKIDLTILPDKAQYSRSGRPVYFAGWLEFHKEGYALPRQQINYQKTIFRFPDGADGYSYTFTNGAAGSVTVYTEEQGEDG